MVIGRIIIHLYAWLNVRFQQYCFSQRSGTVFFMINIVNVYKIKAVYGGIDNNRSI